MWSPFVYFVGSILNAFSLFLQGYFLVLLGDLELDYINPIDLCNKINKYMLPEMIIHASISVLLLITGHFWSFLFNVPLLALNFQFVRSKKYLLDATEIFKTMLTYKRNCFIRLVFYLFAFFYYLFHMIIAIVKIHGMPEKRVY